MSRGGCSAHRPHSYSTTRRSVPNDERLAAVMLLSLEISDNSEPFNHPSSPDSVADVSSCPLHGFASAPAFRENIPDALFPPAAHPTQHAPMPLLQSALWPLHHHPQLHRFSRIHTEARGRKARTQEPTAMKPLNPLSPQRKLPHRNRTPAHVQNCVLSVLLTRIAVCVRARRESELRPPPILSDPAAPWDTEDKQPASASTPAGSGGTAPTPTLCIMLVLDRSCQLSSPCGSWLASGASSPPGCPGNWGG
ncbi:hypothetical protein BU16DRAFT_535268 [Lophium mytilinum]|uniref:Uncharacterized protein n=1 Tax=Lophium mytilinum TaxID=390894 RepID=A0A6A6R7H4_9PEZI|nr:hypothetical protein BU16DRAFT_535268 [Lophium mytilinum]